VEPKVVRYEIADRIAVVTLDRLERGSPELLSRRWTT
jgi:hypothetical protein